VLPVSESSNHESYNIFLEYELFHSDGSFNAYEGIMLQCVCEHFFLTSKTDVSEVHYLGMVGL